MLLTRLLDRLVTRGSLALIDAAGTTRVFGDGTGKRVTFRLKDKKAEREIVLRPDLGLAEVFMDERLEVEEGSLYDFLDLLAVNIEHNHTQNVTWRLDGMAAWLLRRLHQYNPVGKAQANVAHHYDLSGDLYRLFLDADRQYSCAYFATGHETIEEAQQAKKRHIAAKLLLEPGQRVLDIGSGWGGLGLYLAGESCVDVTGLTLSKEQHGVANTRAARAGLGERVRFDLRDYRQMTGQFDRIVSVGMFEHVGVNHFGEYFAKVRDLLKPDGVMLLHSIGRMSGPSYTASFIRKYIFPGGYIPALSEVLPAIERSGLWVTDIEILRLHYAETVRRWRERFMANRDTIKTLYDERFCRMWEFYLVSSELFFRRQDGMVFQIQIARDKHSVPLTRDYIPAFETDRQDRHGMAA